MITKNKTILIMLSLAALALAGWVILFYLAINKADVIAEKNDQIRQLKDKKSNLTLLDNSIQDTVINRRLLDSYFYNEDSIINLIEIIESLAGRSGVEIDLSNIDSGEELKLSMRVEGSFIAIQDFIKRLETGPFISQFEKVTLQERSAVVEEEVVENWSSAITLKILSFTADDIEE